MSWKIRISSILGLALFFGCTSVNINSDYDAKADFSSYKTYAICMNDMEVENEKHPVYDNTFNRSYVKEVIISEMNNIGYKLDETNSELSVGFQIILADRQVTVSNCRGFYRYYYWPECRVDTYNYTDGTLVVFVSDIKKNQVIWQGSANAALNTEQKNMREVINKAVIKIFNEYPIEKIN